MKILLAVVLAFFVAGCSDDVAETKPVKEVAKVEETSMKMPTVAEVKEKVAEVQKSVSEMEVPSTEEVTKVVKEKTTEVVAEVKDAVNAAMIDEKALYASCTGCHGVNGEKKALGKSAVIQGWDAQKTIDALNGYKDGSYGGAMKGMMKGQAAKMNEAETKAIANYISNL